jgi:hypothetical protein
VLRDFYNIGYDVRDFVIHWDESVWIILNDRIDCDFASLVWKEIFRWFELVMVIPPSIASLFDCFIGAAGNKKQRSGYC